MSDVPAAVRLAALAALSQGRAEFEIAELVSGDTEADQPTPLTFVAGDNQITINVLKAADLREIAVRLDPPREATIEIWHPGEQIASASADRSGAAQFDGISHGPVSIICRADDLPGSGIQTTWVTI
jgi:hypothetical protein